MIAEKMKPFVQNNSAIRMMFEEGNRLRAKYGADKVYDFSLGNPSVPAPDCVREAIIDLVNNEEPTVLHGYMSNAGFEDVRETIAQSLNRRFETAFSAHNLIMTVGAASGLNVILKTILNSGEEVIVFAPYFLEYGAYVRNYDGKLVEISPNTETFQPNLKELEEKKDAIQRKKDKEISKKIAGLWEQRMQIPQYHYENNDLFVMMPHGTSDLKKEGRSLNHCVADYKEFVAEEKTQIFFIRKKAAPQKSFYTLEIKNHEIEQCHGRNNVDMTEEIRSFAYGYLKQLNTLNEKAAVKAVA